MDRRPRARDEPERGLEGLSPRTARERKRSGPAYTLANRVAFAESIGEPRAREDPTTRAFASGLLAGAAVAIGTQWADNAATLQVHLGTLPKATLAALMARDGVSGMLLRNVSFRLIRLPALLSFCAAGRAIVEQHWDAPADAASNR